MLPLLPLDAALERLSIEAPPPGEWALSPLERRTRHAESTRVREHRLRGREARALAVERERDNVRIDATCAICLLPFDDALRPPAPEARCVLPCEHAFHCGCVSRWLARKATCPVCRAPVASRAPYAESVESTAESTPNDPELTRIAHDLAPFVAVSVAMVVQPAPPVETLASYLLSPGWTLTVTTTFKWWEHGRSDGLRGTYREVAIEGLSVVTTEARRLARRSAGDLADPWLDLDTALHPLALALRLVLDRSLNESSSPTISWLQSGNFVPGLLACFRDDSGWTVTQDEVVEYADVADGYEYPVAYWGMSPEEMRSFRDKDRWVTTRTAQVTRARAEGVQLASVCGMYHQDGVDLPADVSLASFLESAYRDYRDAQQVARENRLEALGAEEAQRRPHLDGSVTAVLDALYARGRVDYHQLLDEWDRERVARAAEVGRLGPRDS